MAHQYAVKYNNYDNRLHYYDMIDESCGNGWSMGNIAASANNLAAFLYDGFTRLLTAESISEILSFNKLVNSWCPTSSSLPW